MTENEWDVVNARFNRLVGYVDKFTKWAPMGMLCAIVGVYLIDANIIFV